jgi:hypothetical protein
MNVKKTAPDSSHLGLEALLDRSEGRMAEASRAQAESHLSRCAKCRKLATEMERLVHAMRSDRAELPPDWARNRARELIRRPAVAPRLPRMIPMTLVFDSWMAPAPARRASVGSRRLMLRGPGLDLDLEIESSPEGEEKRLQGQALPEDRSRWKGLTAWLSRRGKPELKADLSARLGFHFKAVPPGKYRLKIVGGGSEYVYDAFEL